MPTPFPKEFRRDVIAVARKGDQTRAQVAKSFGISDSCLPCCCLLGMHDRFACKLLELALTVSCS